MVQTSKKMMYEAANSYALPFYLCDQNSFGQSKMVLVWPNWFGLDHNDLVTTKIKGSQPKWIGQVQMWFILAENHNLDQTNSFWSWPFHFGHDQIIWSSPNQFGQTKTILDRPKLNISRRARHKSLFSNGFVVNSL